jgi:hypothetical protein
MNVNAGKKKTGTLRGWMTVIAVIFFVFAAAFEFKAASYSPGRALNTFQKILAAPSVTPDMIRQNGADVTDVMAERGKAEKCHYTGLALAMLGFASISIGVGFSRTES